MTDPHPNQSGRRWLPWRIVIGGVMIAAGILQHHPAEPSMSVAQVDTATVIRKSPDDFVGKGAIVDNSVESKTMLQGRCFAGSPIEDTDAFGGFGTSDNMPKKVAAGSGGKGVYLLAEPEKEMSYGDQTCMSLSLVNQTDKPVAFPAQDSRLSIIQEAQDAQGNWQPIEYLRTSDCGNSYHKVTLPAGQYWEFPVPRYRGSLQTTLRFTWLGEGGKDFHSNEFEGSIHPSQFELPDDVRTMPSYSVIRPGAYTIGNPWADESEQN